MMDFDREETMLPVGSIIYGGLAMLLMMMVLTVFLGVFTELGWMGTITWPNNSIYLLVLYVSVIAGSVLAGWRAHKKGWIVGIGAGMIISITLVILALIMHTPIHWGIFLVKALINIFIGAFGGIIGVNIAGRR